MAWARWLERWDLVPDGAPIVTPGSRLLPVRRDGTALMLKVAMLSEEQAGAVLLRWWDGDGAAAVIEADGDAVVMERATGDRSLAIMARDGRDDEASRILVAVAGRLHIRSAPPPSLVPLAEWFEALWPAAEGRPAELGHAARVARALLADQTEVLPLHGDLHHGNVLDFGARGWLAIDPKGLLGERAYDFANIVPNPDAEVALRPGRLERQLDVVAAAAHVERVRLLRWSLAHAGLSIAWHLEDGTDPTLSLAIVRTTSALLHAD